MNDVSYSKIYLYDAMRNLGECVDYAVNGCKYDIDLFMDMFLKSNVATAFGSAHPKFICGMSGTELAAEVILRITDRKECDLPVPLHSFDRSPQYWCGWVSAAAQWQLGISFRRFFEAISWSEVVRLYHPFHEADDEKFIHFVSERINALHTVSRLSAYRKRIGITQSELSKRSGVNLRTLQQYEINSKDIKKASVSAVSALSKALGCEIEDIL